MTRSSSPKKRSRWLGESRDAGGQFLQSDRRRRTRIILIVVIVAVAVAVITGLIARASDDPKIDLIDALSGDGSEPVALASSRSRLTSTTHAAPAVTTSQVPAATTTTIPVTATTAASVTTTLASVTTVPPAPPVDPAPPGEPAPEPAPPTVTPDLTPVAPIGETITVHPAVEVAGFSAALAALDALGIGKNLFRVDGHSLLRAPTPAFPLRLYIGGDSMSGTPGLVLEGIARHSDMLDVVVDTRTSSGMVSDWFFDWPAHIENDIAPQGFDVIVLTMGANDAQRFRGSNWPVGTDEWLAKYRARMSETLQKASAPGRLVVWIGMPPVTPSNIKPVMPQVNAVATSLAEEFDNVEYVDAWSLFVDDEGGFSTHLLDENGERVLVRAGDGVHYAIVAGRWLADAVLTKVEAEVDSSTPVR